MKESIVIIISDIGGGIFTALPAVPPVCPCQECFIVSCVMVREPLWMLYHPGCMWCALSAHIAWIISKPEAEHNSQEHESIFSFPFTISLYYFSLFSPLHQCVCGGEG